MTFEWDWRIIGDEIFGVVFGIRIPPLVDQHYDISAVMVAEFQAKLHDDDPSLQEFCLFGAPAIMFPFLRQYIATMTSQSNFGPVLLPPTNLKNSLGDIEFEKSSGYLQASDHPFFREALGLKEQSGKV